MMVSQISARLLAGTRDDSPLSERLSQGRFDTASQGSGSSKASRKSSSSFRQKRTASGAIKNSSSSNEKVASSIGGYSADKEDASVLPPVVSIDLLGRDISSNNHNNNRNAVNYPKRQKINEMQFAATLAKDDLERAGMEFKTMSRDLEEVQFGGTDDGNLKIKLKGVRLIHSREVLSPLITSNVSQRSTVADYMALFHAVRTFYPAPSRMNINPVEESGVTRDGSSSDSTSSVSDTESDSGSDNVNNGQNNQLFFLPPRVEDSLDSAQLEKWTIAETTISPCNVISCASNAKTMMESIQLSKDPRLVTSSTMPYQIVHANAAFLRLSGKAVTDNVLGTSFLDLLDPSANVSGSAVNLTSCMVSSSMGQDSKLFLLPKSSTTTTMPSSSLDPVECSIRVSPIVERKTLTKEVTTVSHFAIELFENLRNGNNHSAIALGPVANAPASDFSVGVMG